MEAARTLLTFFSTLLLGAAGFQALLYLVRHRRGSAARPADERGPMVARILSGLASFSAECAAFCVAMATSPWRRAPGRAPFAAQRRPIVLIHGYALSGASFALMARRLRRDGWTWVWPINHVPAFGDIDRNVGTLAAAVDEVRRLSGAGRVDIVAHSMGGLVARAFVRNGGAAVVHRVITLGTPHCGTVYGNLVGWADPMVRQMQIDSAFLDALSHEDPVPELARVVSIYSLFDAVVVPPKNAYYPGACNIEIDGVGHNALLLSRRVYDLIRENLAADDTDSQNDFMRGDAQV
jgi:triacylglycerol esterase/lipase EstA (alpha/beta hydrolase family)